ncbi:MAG TPA: hypothetical protein VFK34_12610 [Marmoricola sp.]|nr:hypothetical protein [Marmoricola sp.]
MNRAAILRTVWGSVLTATPGLVLSATHEDSTTPARAVLRLLGLRHVAQGTVLAAKPEEELIRVGAVVDLLHASTAFGFAAVNRRWRRTALLSGVAATTFGVHGLVSSRD